MTRSELIKEVATRTGLTQIKAKEIVEAQEAVIAEFLPQDGEVSVFKGLTLKVKDVPETNRRNPATGETFVAPAHQKVVAKLGTAIKGIVE